MNNNIKKGVACIISTAIVLTSTGLSTVGVFASEIKDKEEVVYVIQDARGNTNSINVVNIFGKGHVVDYGNYSQVKMLNTTEPIYKKGNKITFTTHKSKVYYQGTLDHKNIPWNIKITYKLDGKTISPIKLAGASGQLEMHIVIDENKNSDTHFYKQYALQAAFTLDGDKCTNIETTGATLANVGNNKQISYTVLPGKGLDTTIKAKVNDFEMEAASINGIKLDLDIDIDNQELMDQVKEIQTATQQLNDGTHQLFSGTSQLKDGGSQLVNGTVDLNKGTSSLNNGMNNLNTGVHEMQKALNVLNGNSKDLTSGSHQMLTALKTVQSKLNTVAASSEDLTKLVDSSTKIKQGIDDAYQGAIGLQQAIQYDSYKKIMKDKGLDIDTLSEGNQQTINHLSHQVNELQNSLNAIKSIENYQNNPEYVNQVKQLETSIENLQQIITVLQGNQAAIGGTQQYFNTISSQVDQLVSGLKTLSDLYEQFDQAIHELANELSNMLLQVNDLKTGINQLVDNYNSLDSGVNLYTDGLGQIVASYLQIVDGTENLTTGSKSLYNGSNTLKQGTADLYYGIDSTYQGVGSLHSATQEFYNQMANVDQQIEEKINSMLDELSGGNEQVESFVSHKNTNVKSVQFVIKTTAIKKQEPKSLTVKSKKKTSFIQKLLNLFK